MHDRVSLQALPVTAVLALEALFVIFPVMLRTATLRANHALFFSDFTPFALAALLVGEFLHKVYQVHSHFLLRRKCTKSLGAIYDNQKFITVFGRTCSFFSYFCTVVFARSLFPFSECI